MGRIRFWCVVVLGAAIALTMILPVQPAYADTVTVTTAPAAQKVLEGVGGFVTWTVKNTTGPGFVMGVSSVSILPAFTGDGDDPVDSVTIISDGCKNVTLRKNGVCVFTIAFTSIDKDSDATPDNDSNTWTIQATFPALATPNFGATVIVADLPEPASILLFGSGLVGLGGMLRRKRR